MDSRPYLLTLSTSWVTLLFFSRTFSNSLEAILYAKFFTTILLYERQPSRTFTNLMVAFLISLGIFTRFTFVIFATPLVLFLAYRLLKSTIIIFYNSSHTDSFMTFFNNSISILIFTIIISLSMVIADTYYFDFKVNKYLSTYTIPS